MRRHAPVLALVVLLSLAFPAVAAQPGDGTYKGTGKYKGSEVVDGKSVPSKESAKVTIKVSGGKVTKFSVIDPDEIGIGGTPRQGSLTFSPALNIRKGGKFSRTVRFPAVLGGKPCVSKLKGRFRTKRKATGTFRRSCDLDSFPKTKFTVRRK